jgi:DNA replication protein DnaC
MREVDESSMVIIDDIGTETDRYRTGIPCSRLCQLLDHCRNKWLWITTNKHPNEWATTWDKRVEDRMLAGDVLVLDAPSWRSDRP